MACREPEYSRVEVYFSTAATRNARAIAHRSKLCRANFEMSYSITSSAVICIVRGTARPSAFAALEIDDVLEFRWLLDRKIRWLLALKDAVEIRRGLPKLRKYIEVVRDHARFGG